MAADLEVFPISLPGGINQSAPEPTESDMEELLNFATFRNRLGLRAPISLIATLEDDQATPVEVEAILDIVEHIGKVYIASWTSQTDKVYLHSMQTDGTTLTLEATLWSSVTSKPTIKLTSFQGGDASNPAARLYACDYNQDLDVVYWDGSAVQTTSQDLEATSSADPLVFSLMIAHKFHLWGTGFYSDGVTRPEMIRFSQPGTIADTDPAGGTNDREWFTADHRSLGRRGDKIVCLASVGDRLLLFQRRASHVIYGSGALTWSAQQLSNVTGAVGPFSAATVDERLAYFWAADGPYRTDGTQIQYIGLPIRQLAIESNAAEEDVRVAYSPDDGLVYFIVSEGGEDSYSRALVFDQRRERWMRSEWLDTDGTPIEFGALAFLEAVASPGPTAAPATVTATATSDTTLTVGWVNGDVNVDTRTHIYRSTTSGFTPNDATNRIAVLDSGVISYDDSGLTADTTYYYKLRHSRNAQHSSSSSQASDTTWLAEPTSVGLAGLTVGLKITGTNNAEGADIVIERKPVAGSYSVIETLSNPGATFSYSDTDVTCGNGYTYRVKATKTGSDDSEYSEEVFREACLADTAPTAPSALSATANGESQIDLSWTDNSDNEDAFEIHRSLDDVTYTLLISKAANTTSHSDTDLDSNTLYYYKVRSVNSAGNSAFTTAASDTTDPNLDTPDDLAATVDGISEIDLAWTDTAGDETGWEIHQSDDASDGTYAHIATKAAGVESYSATGLSANTQYWFKVRPVFGATQGTFSNIATATTDDLPSDPPPAAPTDLTATKDSESPTDTINLSWTDAADNEDSFEIWRDSGGGFVLIDSVVANVESYIDTPLTAGTAYTYKLRGFDNVTGYGPFSDTATDTTDGTPTAPAAPTDFAAETSPQFHPTTGAESWSVDFTWTDNSPNEDEFIIEHCSGAACSSWVTLATLPAGTESHSITVSVGQTAAIRRYRIKASNTTGDSSYDDIVEVTIGPQYTPFNADAVDSSACAGSTPIPLVTVSWEAGTTTGLERVLVQRRNGGSSGSFTTIKTFTDVSPVPDSYDDDDVSFGGRYEYNIVFDFDFGNTDTESGVTTALSTPDCSGGGEE